MPSTPCRGKKKLVHSRPPKLNSHYLFEAAALSVFSNLHETVSITSSNPPTMALPHPQQLCLSAYWERWHEDKEVAVQMLTPST